MLSCSELNVNDYPIMKSLQISEQDFQIISAVTGPATHRVFVLAQKVLRNTEAFELYLVAKGGTRVECTRAYVKMHVHFRL